MSTTAFPISASEAARVVEKARRQQRNQRLLPTLPPNLQAFSKQTQVFIHNVGPWEHKVMLGSWGQFMVPACPKGKPYASMAPIPGVFTEPIPVNEKKFDLENIEGSFVAEQIMGEGKNMAKSASLRRLGVFSSLNEVPTQDELGDARDALHHEYVRLVEEAELAFSQGPSAFQSVVGDGTKHKLAAAALGRTDVKWMQQASVGKRIQCPNCGEYSDPQVISCSHCTYIFDTDRYEKEIAGRLAGKKPRG